MGLKRAPAGSSGALIYFIRLTDQASAAPLRDLEIGQRTYRPHRLRVIVLAHADGISPIRDAAAQCTLPLLVDDSYVFRSYGMDFCNVAYLVSPDRRVVWRGPSLAGPEFARAIRRLPRSGGRG